MIFHSLFFANLDFPDRLFRVEANGVTFTQGYRFRANPGLKLANAFGVVRRCRPNPKPYHHRQLILLDPFVRDLLV
jgi:hypothetical protein